MNKLHTTHSWEFLGIDSAQQYNQMPMESTSNIIVGVIDTGKDPYLNFSLNSSFILLQT